MKLNHIGVVTRDLAASGAAYQKVLGLTPISEVLEDPLQKVWARFWKDEAGSVVELIEPTGPDSPIWREAQKGGGLNHLCYETPDLEKTIEESTQSGASLVRPIAPGIAFGGRRIAFLYFLDLGLIEFLETPGQ